MARVRSVGAIATLSRVPELAQVQEAQGIANVHMRLFAKLDNGLLAIDPNPQTAGFGVPLQSAERAIDMFELMLRSNDLPGEHRQAQWSRVVHELASTFDVHIDAETLKSLPFELIADDETRAMFGGS